MAKLYFRYGTVGSAKTLNLLAVAHNYERQGKKVLVLKPSFDVRWGSGQVVSRAGLERLADVLLSEDTVLDRERVVGHQCLLVDEAQFLSPGVVEQLREITRTLGIPVICYGLRTDFRTRLFPGSLRLLELADTIEEIKTTCAHCNAKAIYNLKSVDGQPSLVGPSKELGAEELYQPVCHQHYMDLHGIDSLPSAEGVDAVSNP